MMSIGINDGETMIHDLSSETTGTIQTF